MKKVFSIFLTIVLLMSMTTVIGTAADDGSNSEDVSAVCSFSSHTFINKMELFENWSRLPDITLFCLKDRYTNFSESPQIIIDGFDATGEQRVHYIYSPDEMYVFASDGVDKCESILCLDISRLGLFYDEEAITEYTLTITAGSMVKRDSSTNNEIIFSANYSEYDGLIRIDTTIRGIGDSIAGKTGTIKVKYDGNFADNTFRHQLLDVIEKVVVVEANNTNVVELNGNFIKLKNPGSTYLEYSIGNIFICSNSIHVISFGDSVKYFFENLISNFFTGLLILVAPILMLIALIQA